MASIGIRTAGVSHEINNPLNYILGGFTGLENYFREEGTHNPRIALFLDSIKTGVERVNAIVSGLGQLSSTKTGLNDACDLHRILENCLNMVDYLFKNRITVHRDLIPEQVFIRGNSGKLHQVFINILLNASQSISGDGSISILSRRVPDGVLICIADSGCGIEPENLPRITDPFYTTREPGKGTGLGLSIAYSIIREHKGDIQFSSEPGKGTRVDITLPVYNEQIR
jgi:signal transduction histidine kinase